MNFASEAKKRCFNEKLSTVRDKLMPLGSPLHSLFSLANRIPTSSATSQPTGTSLLVHLSISIWVGSYEQALFVKVSYCKCVFF